MAVRWEDTAQEVNDLPIGCSWIPTTPAKPNSAKQQLISTDWQEKYHVGGNSLEQERSTAANQVTQLGLSESGKLQGDFVRETQYRAVPSCSSSVANISGGFNNWQDSEATNSHVCGNNLCCFDTWQTDEIAKSHVHVEDLHITDKLSINDAENWTNMSFGDLLALAHTACNTAVVENEVAQTDFVAASSTSHNHFHPKNQGNHFTMSWGNSLLPDNDSLVEAGLKSIPDILGNGTSMPYRPLFDLNSLPRTMTDSALSKTTRSHFEPITAEKINGMELGEDSTVRELSTDEVHAAKDAQENRLAGDEVKGLLEKKEGSQLASYEFYPGKAQLQENYKPDKEGTEEADLVKTPQQKPRRKKHRPKVIIQDQPKGSPKSSGKQAAHGQQTTAVKRKYVRRKGVENPAKTPAVGETDGTDPNRQTPDSTDTPRGKRKYVRRKGNDIPEATVDKETTEATDVTILRHTRRSCRRSLNFDLEVQVKDGSSSHCASSNCNRGSQAENSSSKDISRTSVQWKHGMEVTEDKNGIGFAYELRRAMNQELEDYLLMHEQHSSSSSSHKKKMDRLQDDHMLREQSVRTRGKCQIVFSDVTHDKEPNNIPVMNHDGQLTQKSLSDSICSSTCLTHENQPRGLKRQHMCSAAEAELCNTNETGAFYNPLQAYLSVFSQNADRNNDTPGWHFPAIFKKKRTEKLYNTATSSSQYKTNASDTHANLERHPLRNSCTVLFTSTTNQGSSVAQCGPSNQLMTNPTSFATQNGRDAFEDLLSFGPTEKIKKKRSKGPTRVRDLASLLEFCKELPTSSGRAATASRIEQESEILHEPLTCKEALVADTCSRMTTKKRSKRSTLINSRVQHSHDYKFATKSIGSPLALTWKSISPVDSIIEQLHQLDLNAESRQASAHNQNPFMARHSHYQEHHALVPYQGGGAVVLFDSSFDKVKRKRPRPKVDLDDETTRVWKLLLEDINSQGIDGNDEKNTKWWEEERRIFSGRADSFIARMHLVQGDRRFSPWKGSVVDSVVGVFLTQNVSDHLSSSAFMSLAARFPLQSNTDHEELHEERLGAKIKEPEVSVPDPDRTSGSNKEILNRSACLEGNDIRQDFEDDAIREANSAKSSENSCDGFNPKDNLSDQSPDISGHASVVSRVTVANQSMNLTENRRDIEDILSSPTAEISSQNSADSPIARVIERSESCVLSTSEVEPTAVFELNSFSNTTSFVKLLQMAGSVLHGVYETGIDVRMPAESWQVQSENLAPNLQYEDSFENPSFPTKSVASCGNSTLSLAPVMGVQGASHSELSQKNIQQFSCSAVKELCTTERSGLSSESAPETTFKKIAAGSFEKGPELSSSNVHSSNTDQIELNYRIGGCQTGQVPAQSLLHDKTYNVKEVPKVPIYPQNLVYVTACSSNIDNSKESEHKEVNSNENDPGYHPGNVVNGTQAKGGRIGKEKQTLVDWDDLRKRAQAGGRKRGQTTNTMSSVDWDAVRCTDVKEIADTIKERGMNNVLAQRIKDFLNRLVIDHGSIDLEWLRDVPPDKAKEYLLSIRGLGLKSVECVRLLTLHHLAFPVDTNVGRIAVRLGWVPLQPLPESLQLHLLELYPVLESIQKYLWPRLCKLDQRTLYELHYQMITFGKVFCTKSKPNCNACPMRAECRHFASAFASARLALPAPEEKSIVSASENKAADQSPMRSMNTLQLPSPQANQMFATSGVSSLEPIVEEPATPEPIIEVPSTSDPGCAQVSECDIEDTCGEDPDDIPTIQLNMEQFTQNLQKIMQQSKELQEGDMSKALVALTAEAASIPMPKLKNVSRLRTEHHVYELPDSHPLLEGLDKRERDDPCPYLLAIWTPGETVNSTQPPESRCGSQGFENLCSDETCLSCNSIREANSQTVRGTLLIPCRTAMRGSFPLNGTYFQVNEVFSDHESSLSPIDVPRQWLWNLPRRTVYFGTSIPTIFKGLSTEGIQYCFWRGFVCVRGFDRKTRAPRPLIARLHFPASKLAKGKGKKDES